MFQLPAAAVVCLSSAALVGTIAFDSGAEAHDISFEPAHGLRCAVITRDFGDTVEIGGKVTSDRSVSGNYTLKIKKVSDTGHAVVDQSGDFSVTSGRTITLSQATLGGTSGSYETHLELTVNGQRLRCLGAGTRTDI